MHTDLRVGNVGNLTVMCKYLDAILDEVVKAPRSINYFKLFFIYGDPGYQAIFFRGVSI